MSDMREKIAAMAQQAAREGAPSLMAHAVRSQDGKARMTVAIEVARMDGGAYAFGTRWQASHTDKDGEDMQPQIIDPRQEEMGL